MSLGELSSIIIFLCVTVAVLSLMSMGSRKRERLKARFSQISSADGAARESGAFNRLVGRMLPAVVAPLMPVEQASRDQLQQRLVLAGYYRPQAMLVFLTVKFALIFIPLIIVGALFFTGTIKPRQAALVASTFGAMGLFLPGMWLDVCKNSRQAQLRRGLPDFFDILVLCMEGGMGFMSAFRRVVGEMENAFPSLYRELKIAEREVDLGRTISDAMRNFANRSGLDDIDILAATLSQAERLGTSITQSLRIMSDSLRVRRVHRAEEMAHKAATKILFPTLLFIFPCVFAIILGPMALQVLNLFQGI